MNHEKEIIDRENKYEVLEEKKLPSVPIYNSDDELEVAIKTQIALNDEFSSYNAVYQLIGFDMLGINNLKGGTQKRIAKEKLTQYAEFEPTGKTAYSVKCVSLFEIPYYLAEKIDGRGKAGHYINHIIPAFISYLLSHNETDYNKTVGMLSVDLGLINSEYPKLIDYEYVNELIESNPSLKKGFISKFYYSCKQELNEIVHRALRRLRDEYKALLFYDKYLIILAGGESFLSDEEWDKMILRAEHETLAEFGVTKMQAIYNRKLEKKFFSCMQKDQR